MRASVNQLLNKLNSEQARGYLAATLTQFTTEEMQAICLTMQANPICAAQLVTIYNQITNIHAPTEEKAKEILVRHLGTTLQLGIMIGFLLSTELGQIHVVSS